METLNLETHPLGQPNRLLNLRHSSLPYWKIGQGPDLLFFHGWPFDSRVWAGVVEHLKDAYTCHLFDLPGAGLSRISSVTPMGLATHVETVSEAMDEMGLAQNNVGYIGHNSGGSIARLVAADRSDRISGMVFGNTEVPNRYSRAFRLVLAFPRLPLAKALFRLAVRSERALSGISMVGPGKRELRNNLETTYFKRFITNERALLGAWTILQGIQVSDFDQLAEAHAKIEAPVGLIWGRHDPWFPLKDAEAMLPTFAGDTQIKVVDHASLMVHLEAPDEFCELVRQTIPR